LWVRTTLRPDLEWWKDFAKSLGRNLTGKKLNFWALEGRMISDFLVGTCFSDYSNDCHFQDFTEKYLGCSKEELMAMRTAHNYLGFLRRISECVFLFCAHVFSHSICCTQDRFGWYKSFFIGRDVLVL